MPRPAPKPSPAELIQQEVMGNILSQPLGGGNVADLNLPREFLVRIADRVTRASFNERHRIVVPSNRGQGASHGIGPESPPPSFRGAPHAAPAVRDGCALADSLQRKSTANLQILDRPLSPETLRIRQSLHEARPANRAFRADDDPETFNTPTPLPPQDVANFKPTVPGFQLLPDDGTHAPRALRLQLTCGTDYAAPGDGGSLDMLRHVAASLPDTPLLVSIERKHLSDASHACEEFAAARAAPITLIVEDLPVAQWAHDNGKPGLAHGQPMALLPRYASRGEDGSVFVPGESFLPEGLAAAGVHCRRSPLLFQGGNMIAFRAPCEMARSVDANPPSTGLSVSEGRVLLIGEAEVARNTALGLSNEQVISALQSEFGVASVVVLPAISYHIDLEVSVRRLNDGRVVALVNDQPTAVRHVLRRGIEALECAGHLPRARSGFLQERLDRGPMNEFLFGAWSDLAKFSTRPGLMLESLSPAFTSGPSDSGVGNIQRFLLALDLLASELPLPSSVDSHLAAVLTSFARRERERRQLRSRLQRLGLTVTGIPSLSDADRGINYLNCVHTPASVLVPSYRGLFSELDRTAQSAITAALGANVRLLSIPSGESQRREGALRCAIAVAL